MASLLPSVPGKMFGLILLAVSPCLAQEAPAPAPAKLGAPIVASCLADLKQLCPKKLEELYAGAIVGCQPVGFFRGEILHLCNTSMPCLKTKMANNVWKGKHFCEDGGFINQWAHIRAIRSHVQTGCSYYDGKPSLILEYPEKTPYFGKMRDEAREIAPGLYLAMVYERGCCPKFRGFIGLEYQPCGCRK